MSGVAITIDSVEYPDVTTFSVSEDSTPIDPSDSTGAVGQFTFGIDEDVNTKLLLEATVNLSDQSQGVTSGMVRGISSNNGDVTVTADSRLALLATKRQAQPFTGTLENAFLYYLGLVGITSGIVVDSTIASRAVIYRGWNEDVWTQLKKLCTAEQVEISLASDNVILRPLRGRVAETYRAGDRTWAMDTSQMARSVEIYYYQNQYRTSSLAYPEGGWNAEVPIFNVNAGETTTYDIPLTSSLSSITQPVPQLSVSPTYSASSVYAVSGVDGLPIPVAQWVDGGGSLTVAINEDTRSLTVTIVGAKETQYSPYSIALSDGENKYSTLRLVGTGVFTNAIKLTGKTSVDPAKVSEEIGATVENEFIRTAQQAYEAMAWMKKRYAGPQYTLNVTGGGINRIGDSGSYAYPTIEEFDAHHVGDTIASFNTEYSGDTIAQFNDYWNGTVADDFANQAFGNVSGAREKFDNAWFRIRTATITPEGVSYTAEDDTTIGDFNAEWSGTTIADFNTRWAGLTMKDFNANPLDR